MCHGHTKRATFTLLSSHSYLFHLTFASSFTFILNTSRWMMTGSRDQEKMAGVPFTEFVCMILTGVLPYI